MGEEEKLQVKKVDSLMGEIIELITPKKEKFVLGDVEILEDTISAILLDRKLYQIAITKYYSKIRTLEYIFKNQISLFELKDKIINDESCNQLELEVSADKFSEGELALLNRIYNLILNSFFTDRTVNIKVFEKYNEENNKENKTNCLQKK